PSPTTAAVTSVATSLRNVRGRDFSVGGVEFSSITSQYCVTVLYNNTKTSPRLVQLNYQHYKECINALWPTVVVSQSTHLNLNLQYRNWILWSDLSYKP